MGTAGWGGLPPPIPLSCSTLGGARSGTIKRSYSKPSPGTPPLRMPHRTLHKGRKSDILEDLLGVVGGGSLEVLLFPSHDLPVNGFPGILPLISHHTPDIGHAYTVFPDGSSPTLSFIVCKPPWNVLPSQGRVYMPYLSYLPHFCVAPPNQAILAVNGTPVGAYLPVWILEVHHSHRSKLPASKTPFQNPLEPLLPPPPPPPIPSAAKPHPPSR